MIAISSRCRNEAADEREITQNANVKFCASLNSVVFIIWYRMKIIEVIMERTLGDTVRMKWSYANGWYHTICIHICIIEIYLFKVAVCMWLYFGLLIDFALVYFCRCEFQFSYWSILHVWCSGKLWCSVYVFATGKKMINNNNYHRMAGCAICHKIFAHNILYNVQ